MKSGGPFRWAFYALRSDHHEVGGGQFSDQIGHGGELDSRASAISIGVIKQAPRGAVEDDAVVGFARRRARVEGASRQRACVGDGAENRTVQPDRVIDHAEIREGVDIGGAQRAVEDEDVCAGAAIEKVLIKVL